MAKRELKSLGKIFRESSQAVRRNLTLYIFLNTITILSAAWDIGMYIRDKNHGSSWGQTLVHSFSSSGNDPKISGWITSLLFAAGIVLYILLAILSVRAARHQTVRFSEVWEIFKTKWWKIIIAEILLFVIVGVGLLALIIPGLYLLARLAFWPIIVIDQDISVAEALNKSWEITKNHAWVVLVTAFFGFLLGLPSIIPIIGPIIATVLTIAYSVALPLRYFELEASSKNG
jgi:membrane-anchored glycerophosphoryl diester phosphodiesterase (GDPDase)